MFRFIIEYNSLRDFGFLKEGAKHTKPRTLKNGGGGSCTQSWVLKVECISPEIQECPPLWAFMGEHYNMEKISLTKKKLKAWMYKVALYTT